MKRLTIDSSVIVASLLKNETELISFDEEMMKKAAKFFSQSAAT